MKATKVIRQPADYAAQGEYEDLFRLEQRKIIIVGAAGGIGMAITEGIAAHGADIIAVDRTLELAEKAVRSLEKYGGKATAEVCDMMDVDSIESLAERHSDASALVILPAALVRKPLARQSLEEIDLQMDLNMKYTLLLARSFAENMSSNGGGSIVAMASIRAQVVEPASGMYSATKAGLIMIMKSLAAEFGPSGVRFNTISPSSVATPLTEDVRSKKQWVDQTRERTMLKRWAEPEDFVGPAVFLLSDASSFLTGTDIVVDGGWTSTDGLARVEG